VIQRSAIERGKKGEVRGKERALRRKGIAMIDSLIWRRRETMGAQEGRCKARLRERGDISRHRTGPREGESKITARYSRKYVEKSRKTGSHRLDEGRRGKIGKSRRRGTRGREGEHRPMRACEQLKFRGSSPAEGYGKG